MAPKVRESLKQAGLFVVGSLIFVGVILGAIFTMRGMVWISDKALPWLNVAGEIAFYVCLFVLLPCCLFRKTRGFACVGLYYASFVFGILLFAASCLFVRYVWGYVGLFIGLLLMGGGIVPVAYLAALMHDHAMLWNLLLATFLTFGARGLGVYLLTREARKEEQEREMELDRQIEALRATDSDKQITDQGELAYIDPDPFTTSADLDELKQMVEEGWLAPGPPKQFGEVEGVNLEAVSKALLKRKSAGVGGPENK